MTVLVTGGAGYIGSHAVPALLEAGRDVLVLDDLSTGRREAVPQGVEFVHGDVGDEGLVQVVLEGGRSIDAVMHFAAFIEVEESVREPIKYYSNNVEKSLALIRACLRAGIESFVFSSSAAVYGFQEHSPVTEQTRASPTNPYGMSKLMTEWMLRDAAAANESFNYIILRYFNVAGADPLQRAGASAPDATHLIRVACQAALGIRDGIDVYGNDYPTRDGTCVRDFIHVSDIASAHVAALDHLLRGGESMVLNCGYGSGYSVKEVLDTVDRVAGVRLKRRDAPRRPGDVAELVADATLIRERLNWRPRHQDLDTIIGSALAWERRLAANAPPMP